MRVTIAVSVVISIVNAQAHIQAIQEGCTPPLVIFCGDVKHELNILDCARWEYLYCTKTLKRTPPLDGCVTPSAHEWDRSFEWRVLISAAPILTLPCLSMDESSLTLICSHDKCNDTLVDKGISECAGKYSRGLVQFVERTDGKSSCPSCPLSEYTSPFLDAHTLLLLLVLALLSIQLAGTIKNAFKLEVFDRPMETRVHHEMCLNAALPTIPRTTNSDESEYQELATDI